MLVGDGVWGYEGKIVGWIVRVLFNINCKRNYGG